MNPGRRSDDTDDSLSAASPARARSFSEQLCRMSR